MNVLFIVTSYWAYGELLIALQFAKRIQVKGYKVHFLVPPSHEKALSSCKIPYTILIPKAGRINQVLIKDLENTFKPQYVILSDFINYYFCEKHYGLKVEDLHIFKGKLGTFDNFDWALKRRGMDTYGYKSKVLDEVDVKNFGFRIVPCPIANPSLQHEKEQNKFYYPLVDEFLPYDRQVKEKVRKELNLPLNKPIVLVTSAVWQQTHKLYPHVESFVEASNKIFADTIIKSVDKGIILCVGPSELFNQKGLTSDVKTFSGLPPEIFEKYAIASDLFLSRNITSTTLAKIALSGIPSVVITNSIFFKQGKRQDINLPFKPTEQVNEILNKLDICYPYSMFPVGWHTFLEPLVRQNPYMDVVINAEQFDEEDTIQKIKNILENPGVLEKFQIRANKYREIVDNLPKPDEVLKQLR
ncbi:hypothetical protein Cpap_1200 [Ruminiclostridium papyrosolvens DSM 2782]|uniref:Uncharacterized protein n=1 Tax=Ruminiclostridium papyrosolvens DSM 2782 TaxID=588581 RepID=F1TF67_9FIRM|nr:DUF6365 family protein [Ruminiclostridium papyrosolvens]EGD47005.1 hypothetical protein Cpap_1200 [Ruminiclostridium papyrosolvens DSM 2782]WES33746.1 DUF6365 family protein [Ruminiclostridium papyrosolvens DSM 2782]